MTRGLYINQLAAPRPTAAEAAGFIPRRLPWLGGAAAAPAHPARSRLLYRAGMAATQYHSPARLIQTETEG